MAETPKEPKDCKIPKDVKNAARLSTPQVGTIIAIRWEHSWKYLLLNLVNFWCLDPRGVRLQRSCALLMPQQRNQKLLNSILTEFLPLAHHGFMKWFLGCAVNSKIKLWFWTAEIVRSLSRWSLWIWRDFLAYESNIESRWVCLITWAAYLFVIKH